MPADREVDVHYVGGEVFVEITSFGANKAPGGGDDAVEVIRAAMGADAATTRSNLVTAINSETIGSGKLVGIISENGASQSDGVITLTAANPGKETFEISDVRMDYKGVQQIATFSLIDGEGYSDYTYDLAGGITPNRTADIYFSGGQAHVTITETDPTLAGENGVIDSKTISVNMGENAASTSQALVDAINAAINGSGGEGAPAVVTLDTNFSGGATLDHYSSGQIVFGFKTSAEPGGFNWLRLALFTSSGSDYIATVFDSESNLITSDGQSEKFSWNTIVNFLNDIGGIGAENVYSATIDGAGDIVFTSTATGADAYLEVALRYVYDDGQGIATALNFGTFNDGEGEGEGFVLTGLSDTGDDGEGGLADPILSALLEGAALGVDGTITLTAKQPGRETFEISDVRLDYEGVTQVATIALDTSGTYNDLVSTDATHNRYADVYFQGGSVFVVITPRVSDGQGGFTNGTPVAIEAAMGNGNDEITTATNLANAIKAKAATQGDPLFGVLAVNGAVANGDGTITLTSASAVKEAFTVSDVRLDYEGATQLATVTLDTASLYDKYSFADDFGEDIDIRDGAEPSVYFAGGKVWLEITPVGGTAVSVSANMERSVAVIEGDVKIQTLSRIYNGASGGNDSTVYQTVEFERLGVAYRVQFFATDELGSGTNYGFSAAAKLVNGSWVLYTGADNTAKLAALASDLGATSVSVDPQETLNTATITIEADANWADVVNARQVKYTTDSPSNKTANSTSDDISLTNGENAAPIIAGIPAGSAASAIQNLVEAINLATANGGSLNGIIAVNGASADGGTITLTAANPGELTFRVSDITLDYQGLNQIAQADFGDSSNDDYYTGGELRIGVTPNGGREVVISADMVADNKASSLAALVVAIQAEIDNTDPLAAPELSFGSEGEGSPAVVAIGQSIDGTEVIISDIGSGFSGWFTVSFFIDPDGTDGTDEMVEYIASVYGVSSRYSYIDYDDDAFAPIFGTLPGYVEFTFEIDNVPVQVDDGNSQITLQSFVTFLNAQLSLANPSPLAVFSIDDVNGNLIMTATNSSASIGLQVERDISDEVGDIYNTEPGSSGYFTDSGTEGSGFTGNEIIFDASLVEPDPAYLNLEISIGDDLAFSLAAFVFGSNGNRTIGGQGTVNGIGFNLGFEEAGTTWTLNEFVDKLMLQPTLGELLVSDLVTIDILDGSIVVQANDQFFVGSDVSMRFKIDSLNFNELDVLNDEVGSDGWYTSSGEGSLLNGVISGVARDGNKITITSAQNVKSAFTVSSAEIEYPGAVQEATASFSSSAEDYYSDSEYDDAEGTVSAISLTLNGRTFTQDMFTEGEGGLTAAESTVEALKNKVEAVSEENSYNDNGFTGNQYRDWLDATIESITRNGTDIIFVAKNPDSDDLIQLSQATMTVAPIKQVTEIDLNEMSGFDTRQAVDGTNAQVKLTIAGVDIVADMGADVTETAENLLAAILLKKDGGDGVTADSTVSAVLGDATLFGGVITLTAKVAGADPLNASFDYDVEDEESVDGSLQIVNLTIDNTVFDSATQSPIGTVITVTIDGITASITIDNQIPDTGASRSEAILAQLKAAIVQEMTETPDATIDTVLQGSLNTNGAFVESVGATVGANVLQITADRNGAFTLGQTIDQTLTASVVRPGSVTVPLAITLGIVEPGNIVFESIDGDDLIDELEVGRDEGVLTDAFEGYDANPDSSVFTIGELTVNTTDSDAPDYDDRLLPSLSVTETVEGEDPDPIAQETINPNDSNGFWGDAQQIGDDGEGVYTGLGVDQSFVNPDGSYSATSGSTLLADAGTGEGDSDLFGDDSISGSIDGLVTGNLKVLTINFATIPDLSLATNTVDPNSVAYNVDIRIGSVVYVVSKLYNQNPLPTFGALLEDIKDAFRGVADVELVEPGTSGNPARLKFTMLADTEVVGFPQFAFVSSSEPLDPNKITYTGLYFGTAVTGQGSFGEDEFNGLGIRQTYTNPDSSFQADGDGALGFGEDGEGNATFFGDADQDFGEGDAGIKQTFTNPDNGYGSIAGSAQLNQAGDGEGDDTFFGDDPLTGEIGEGDVFNDEGVVQTYTNPDNGYTAIDGSPQFNGEGTGEGNSDLFGSDPGYYDDDGLVTTWLNGETPSANDVDGSQDRYITNDGEGLTTVIDLDDTVNVGEDPVTSDLSGEDILNDREGFAAFDWDEGTFAVLTQGNVGPDVIYNFQTGEGADLIELEGALADSTQDGSSISRILGVPTQVPTVLSTDIAVWSGEGDDFSVLPNRWSFDFGLSSATEPFTFVVTSPWELNLLGSTVDGSTYWTGTVPTGSLTFANVQEFYSFIEEQFDTDLVNGGSLLTPDEAIVWIYSDGVISADVSAASLQFENTGSSAAGIHSFSISGTVDVGVELDLSLDEFALVNSENSNLIVSDIGNAANVAMLLSEIFDFTITSNNEVINTTVFAVTASDDDSVTAIWAHQQSFANDSTVDALELYLLATVNTIDGEFTLGNFNIPPIG